MLQNSLSSSGNGIKKNWSHFSRLLVGLLNEHIESIIVQPGPRKFEGQTQDYFIQFSHEQLGLALWEDRSKAAISFHQKT